MLADDASTKELMPPPHAFDILRIAVYLRLMKSSTQRNEISSAFNTRQTPSADIITH